MSRCASHVNTTFICEVGNSADNLCPECWERICTRCLTAAPESWMSGYCDDCYRNTRREKEAQQGEYKRQREMGKLADAWDEGRASIALDFLSPIGDSGMRQSSANPYRLPQAEDGASRD